MVEEYNGHNSRSSSRQTTNKHLSCCIDAKNVQLQTDNVVALWTKLKDRTKLVSPGRLYAATFYLWSQMPQHKLANSSGQVIDP